MEPSLGCVIMGAGSSTRFGGKNKLLEPFADATVGEHVLNVLPFDIIDRSVLVTGVGHCRPCSAVSIIFRCLSTASRNSASAGRLKSDLPHWAILMMDICSWSATSRC